MASRTSSQANFNSGRPRKRQKRSTNGARTPINWHPSTGPIPEGTDGFVYCEAIDWNGM